MKRERLYMVHGTGPDRVGLVGRITAPIAQAGGNIVDLRQDVLHGLFTIFMVVDLSETKVRVAELKSLVQTIAEDTELELRVDNFAPVPRNPEKQTMLVVLIGRDKPGIIASMSERLGKYQVNIESAQNVAREDIFLMELMVDISQCALPLDNVKQTLAKAMAAMDITAIFQTEDVFNKKKRVVLFDIRSSFLAHATVAEILDQTGLTPADLAAAYPAGDVAGALRRAASLLEGFPADVLANVAEALTPTPGTMELLQTLRTMGYSIALCSGGFSPFVNVLRRKLNIAHAVGVELPVDHDSRAVTGEIPAHALDVLDVNHAVGRVAASEGVGRDEVTVVAADGGDTPGIRLELDLGVLLDLYNKRAIGKDALVGILGGFGALDPAGLTRD